MPRQFGSKRMTKQHNRTALFQCLVMRENIDLTERERETLCRCYGVTIPVLESMLADERSRRGLA